jgi:hypothetical protein
MVRQSEVLAYRKKWLFRKVTPVSIQTFVEGLFRFANVLEATNGTLKNVNNIFALLQLTVQNMLYCFPLTLLVYDDECCIIMSTTFAAFVSTGMTLAYSCVRLRNFCPHQQVSQTVWLFEGNHGRLRKDFGQFGIVFDGFPMLTNGVEAVSQTGMVCEDTRGSFTFLFFFVLK